MRLIVGIELHANYRAGRLSNEIEGIGTQTSQDSLETSATHYQQVRLLFERRVRDASGDFSAAKPDLDVYPCLLRARREFVASLTEQVSAEISFPGIHGGFVHSPESHGRA